MFAVRFGFDHPVMDLGNSWPAKGCLTRYSCGPPVAVLQSRCASSVGAFLNIHTASARLRSYAYSSKSLPTMGHSLLRYRALRRPRSQGGRVCLWHVAHNACRLVSWFWSNSHDVSRNSKAITVGLGNRARLVPWERLSQHAQDIRTIPP